MFFIYWFIKNKILAKLASFVIDWDYLSSITNCIPQMKFFPDVIKKIIV
jgi:hypothetical protein